MEYADAHAAIDWLGRAFGFERIALHENADGTVAHAELRLDGAVIMLGTAKQQGPLGLKRPHAAGGPTQGVYVALERDAVDARYERAKAAGAEIVRELHDTDYGSRDFIALDPEGHLWSFGTYTPEES
jgi:uncharacterized glyoxalase superfamily protein PhnB